MITPEDVLAWWDDHPEYATRTNMTRGRYTYGENHCLVGQFLADTNNPTLPDEDSVDNELAAWFLLDGEEACGLLTAAQVYADLGNTWGSSIEKALLESSTF